MTVMPPPCGGISLFIDTYAFRRRRLREEKKDNIDDGGDRTGWTQSF